MNFGHYYCSCLLLFFFPPFWFLVFGFFLSSDPGASFIPCFWGVTVFCVLAIHARIHLSPSGHGRGFGVWRNAYAFYTGLDPLLEVDFVPVFFDFFSFFVDVPHFSLFITSENGVVVDVSNSRTVIDSIWVFICHMSLFFCRGLRFMLFSILLNGGVGVWPMLVERAGRAGKKV